MKIGVCGDIHYCRDSSIIRMTGVKYSQRLENCNRSINWFESLTKDCDFNVYLGDAFDSNSLNVEEITAINDIEWNRNKKYFLVGNHEMGRNDLSFSSSHLFNLIPNCEVIDKPGDMYIDKSTQICFIPYMLSDKEFSIENQWGDTSSYINRIIFSHNDIKGIQMGKFLSTTGLDMDEISRSCNLFINGHLHNGVNLTDKIINLGNLTGQNFSEDASIYTHRVMILDTDTNKITFYENPYAFNFFKFTIDTLDDIDFCGKSNIVCTIKCKDTIVNTVKSYLEDNKSIIASRVIAESTTDNTITESMETLNTVDHIKQFVEYVTTYIGNDAITIEELQEVIK